MKQTLNTTLFNWSLPSELDVSPDELQVRLDFYKDCILLHDISQGTLTTRMVSAEDLAQALLNNIPMHSGLLPPDTLWWRQKEKLEIGLWVKPQVWSVALIINPAEPPQRFSLPMPGLIFICSPCQPPSIYAAKRRPQRLDDIIYHAPVFNVFKDGRSCAGSHKYPQDVTQIPKSFFSSFFSIDGVMTGRSKKHPDSLYALWQELNGKQRYPLDDLVPCGTVQDIINI